MRLHRSFVCAIVALSSIVSLSRPAVAQQGRAGQQTGAGPMETRLFPLQFLSNQDAATLIAPFVQTGPRYGVFEAGPAVRGITVRASKEIITRVDSILTANDRAPVTIVLRFQLIAALDSTIRDAAIPADVEGSLRELFKFGGYRLLAQGSTSVGKAPYQVTMAYNTEHYSISGGVDDIREQSAASRAGSAGTASVELNVRLSGTFDTHATNGVVTGRATDQLLSTGLTVPIGQTVVLGSAAAREGRRALILTVRPEILRDRR